MAIPAPLIHIMRRQLGLICRVQVCDAGIPADTLDSWLRRGELEAVERGVYRRPGAPTPEAQHILAAVFRAGRGARATGASACALYGLEGFDLRDPAWVAVPPERRVRGVDFIVARTVLTRVDLATVAGVPSVTPIRAVIDAAARVQGKPLRVGIDDGRRHGTIDLGRLLRRAVDLGRHPGAVVVRRMFDGGLLDQDGELERQLALALADIGLVPAWGMEVLPGIVPDACFPEASYIIECDGGRWHTIEADRAADVTREGVLAADGWHVDRVRSADVRDRPDRVVSAIRETRAARIEAGLGRPPEWRPVRPGRRVRPPRS